MTNSILEPMPRPEHPRPDFMRETFANLNGCWQFAFDDENIGLGEHWETPGITFPLQIQVPFCYQCSASGIGDTKYHPVMWYKRAFSIPEDMAGRQILLRFGAVDHACQIYINGQMAGSHVGGYTPFAVDITHDLKDKANEICLRVEDTFDCSQLRGKQHWDHGLMGCWYTPVSGIWQTVYLEAVEAVHLQQLHITPDIDQHIARVDLTFNQIPSSGVDIEVVVSFQEKVVRRIKTGTQNRHVCIPVDLLPGGGLQPVHWWSPSEPNLYDITVRAFQGEKVLDTVSSNFGMRKIEVREGMVWLNNSPLYQRLVLDQGYWPETLLTPPSDAAIQEDIRLTLALGYNGARKHQKIEDPRYYYWADRLGLLVWGELPSPYDFTDETVSHLSNTLMQFIDRDFNHPCIIAWVPLNESWGVREIYADTRQQATGRMLYHLAKAADGTRLVSSNDGWEQVTTDICALHDYAADGETIAKHFADRSTIEKTSCDWRASYANSETPTGKEAFMLTEYGGIAFQSIGEETSIDCTDAWGYHDKVADSAAFFARFQALTDSIRSIPYCCGYCYTQLTDVMQEVNGLLTPNRTPKIDIETFRAMNKKTTGRSTLI